MKTLISPIALLTSAFAVLVLALPLPVGAQITNGVFLPGSTPYGQTYAQWSAGWWQWNYSLPTTNSPIQDTAPVNTGQSGPVWFLGGTFGHGGDQTRVRSGTVPEGTALFVAIMEAWADNANCPADNYTTAQLRSLAANAQDPALAMSCTIDGQNTVDLNSPAYRVQSPVFNYTVPGVHNYLYDLFGANCYLNPDGTPFAITGAVADGVYLLIAPLAAGAHTIHFSGSYPTGFIVPPYFYVQDITYNLTVVPAPALTMIRQDTNIVLSWPQTASGYGLQATSTLTANDWVPTGATVQPVGVVYQATIPIGSGNQFFRLKKN